MHVYYLLTQLYMFVFKYVRYSIRRGIRTCGAALQVSCYRVQCQLIIMETRQFLEN